MAPTTQYNEPPRHPGGLRPTRQGGIGVIVALSLASGFVVALILLAAPFIKAQETVLTGVVLIGFAFGWALLAVLSVRFSDQPQRWAAALQDKLATLSTNSRHRVVADATHQSLLLDETDAAAASHAIRHVVASVRTSQPLPP